MDQEKEPKEELKKIIEMDNEIIALDNQLQILKAWRSKLWRTYLEKQERIKEG